MFSHYLFNCISCLSNSRWVRDYQTQDGPYENTSTARLGLVWLEINRCFVLDQTDARVYMHLPTPWGELYAGYALCQGQDALRRPGWDVHWSHPYRPPLPAPSAQDIPF